MIARLARDTRGSATTHMLSFAPTWFVVFGVFLMNTQLARSYAQRDVVDHVAALAADKAMKTLCADAGGFGGVARGDFSGARAQAVEAAITPLTALVSNGSACHVGARLTGGAAAVPGARELEVQVSCDFPCEIPIAAQAMCSGSPRHLTFTAKQTTTAMGCDAADGS